MPIRKLALYFAALIPSLAFVILMIVLDLELFLISSHPCSQGDLLFWGKYERGW
jgi:hypothetical protein